jgi:hypothetical protein
LSSGNAVFESSTNEINQLHATIANGNFVFSHASDLQIDQVSANTVHLTSINGSVLSDGNIDTIDIQAENVILSAAQDIKDITFADQTSLTATADNIDIITNKNLILVDLSASQISVQSNQQLAVGHMTATNIDLTASTITQHEGRITSQKLSLQADHGIGTESKHLETQVSQLDALNQYSGDMYISNTGQLTLIDLNNDNRAIDNMGGGSIITDDALLIQSDIQQSNDFRMISQKDLTIDANVINIGGRTIEMVSDADLIQKSGILLSDAGTISLTADSISQQSGELLTGTLELAATHDIDLTNAINDADILKANAGALHYKDQNEIKIQELHTSNDIHLIAERISDHAADELVDMISDNSGIHLHAGSISGIELADESNINIQSTGDIQLSGIGKLNIENIQAIDQEIDISAIGDISFNSLEAKEIILTASGNIESNAHDLNADNIRLDATGAITGATGAINIADGARIWAKSVESDVQLHGAGEITLEDIQAAKDVKISADSRMIANRISAQNIDLSTSDILEVGQITAINEIFIQSESIMSSSQNSLVSAQSLILKTKDGIGTEDNAFKTSVEQLDAANSTNGDIYISNVGKLNLVDLDGDNMAISNAGGGTIETHSPMTISDNIVQTTDFSLIAGQSNTDDDTLTIKANIENQSDGRIHLKAGSDIMHQSGVITSKQVNMEGKTGSIIQTGGGILADTVSFIAMQDIDYQSEENVINVIGANVHTGDFTFTADEDISISKIIAGGSITISASSINDYQTDTDADIQTTGNIQLTASTIGSANNDLDIGDNAILSASTTGTIYLHGTGNLTLADIHSNDNIIVKTSEGDLTVEKIDTEMSVELSSEKGAIKKMSDSNIIAESLVVKAKTGIDIATQAEKIDAIVIGPGDIQIDESDQVLLNTLTTFEGSIVVNAGGSLEAMEVHSVDGDVTINAQGDMIARKISATKRTHSDIHDVTLSTIGGNMTIDLLVADDAVVINVEDGELMDDNDADVDIHARTLIGDVSNINRVKFDVSNLSLTSLHYRILTYHDYLQPVEKELVVPDMDLDLDLSDMVIHIDSQVPVFVDYSEMLDRSYVAFSENSLLEGDELDYEVKWVDEDVVVVAYEAVGMEELEEEVVVTEKPALKYLGAEDFGAKKGFFAKVRGAWARFIGERK